jgi:hypothetical protein
MTFQFSDGIQSGAPLLFFRCMAASGSLKRSPPGHVCQAISVKVALLN